MKLRRDAPRQHLTARSPQPLSTAPPPLQMFEQKSDKKLMTTVVLGWRRAAERGRMERRQGGEMAAAAAAAAAVEEQRMAGRGTDGEGEVRVEHARRAHHSLIGWKGVWEAAALTRKQEALRTSSGGCRMSMNSGTRRTSRRSR